MSVKTVNGPGVGGIHPEPIVVTMKASEAISQYYICQIDITNAATTTAPGLSTSPFYLVRQPDTESGTLRTLSTYVFGVAQEAIAAGATGKVMLRGYTPMRCDGSTVQGSALVPAADGEGDLTTGGTNFKVIALALEADTSNIANVWFDGINGFGNDVGTNVST